MANVIQRYDPQSHLRPYVNRDPIRMMRDMLRWEPFREGFPTLDENGFTPRFDVKETKDALVIQADLPGMTDKDISISVTGNRLTLSGERKVEEQDEDESYYMYERSYGSFHRTFTLPDEVDVKNVQAEMKDGVLRLKLPKRPETQPRRIEIKAGK